MRVMADMNTVRREGGKVFFNGTDITEQVAGVDLVGRCDGFPKEYAVVTLCDGHGLVGVYLEAGMIEPVVTDGDFPCHSRACMGRITSHRRVIYKDREYRTCHVCGRKTDLVPGDDVLREVGLKDVDRTKNEFDFKRAAKRKYKPRQDKEEDDQ